MTAAAAQLDTKGNKSRKIKSADREQWLALHVRYNGKMGGLLSAAVPSDKLDESDIHIVKKTAQALSLCSTIQWIGRLPDSGEIIQDTYSCHSRFCAVCNHWKSRAFQAKADTWVDDTGKTRVDGAGKLAGNRTNAEIGIWMASKIAILSYQNRLPEDDANLRHLLTQVTEAGDLEGTRYGIDLHWHFITLTIPNVSDLWKDGKNLIDEKILGPFRKLWATSRRKYILRKIKKGGKGRKPIVGMRLWAKIKGYFGKLEITYNKKTQTFHPHIHLLVVSEREFLPKSLILAAWQHYVGKDAQIIDVKKADPLTVGKELMKYVTKTADMADDPQAAAELVRASYRRRFVFSGGSCYGVKWSKEQAQAEQEKRLTQEQPIIGTHMKRKWNAEKQCYDYQILGAASRTNPIKSQLQRQRAPGLLGELLTGKYRQNELDRRTAQKGKTFKPESPNGTWEQNLRAWARAKIDAYWKQNPVSYVVEWILTWALNAIASNFYVEGEWVPWTPVEWREDRGAHVIDPYPLVKTG